MRKGCERRKGLAVLMSEPPSILAGTPCSKFSTSYFQFMEKVESAAEFILFSTFIKKKKKNRKTLYLHHKCGKAYFKLIIKYKENGLLVKNAPILFLFALSREISMQ
jgi:hypothetical protein